MQPKKDQMEMEMEVKNSYRHLYKNLLAPNLASEDVKPAGRFFLSFNVSPILRLECSVPLHLLKIQDPLMIFGKILNGLYPRYPQPSDDCAVCLVKERCRFAETRSLAHT